MGIEWLDSYCPDKPTPPHSHYLIGASRVDGGIVFFCSHCHKVRWLPASASVAIRFTELISRYGEQEGYWRILDEHPMAKMAVYQLQSLYYLNKSVPDDIFVEVVRALLEEDLG